MVSHTKRRSLGAVLWAYAPLWWVLLGYIAFLIVGYGGSLRLRPGDDSRALPLYIYLSLLLLGVQWLISETRSLWHNVWVYFTSLYAIIYAGYFYFYRGQFLLDRPWFYFFINGVIFAFFFYDALQRQRAQAGKRKDDHALLVTIGANAAGFAVLCAITWGLTWFLPTHHWAINPDLPSHPLGIATLGDLDRTLALAAFILALLCIAAEAVRHGWAVDMRHRKQFADLLRDIGSQAVDEGTRSLGLALNPFIWLMPAFAVAAFAWSVTSTLAGNASSHLLAADPWWQLFNPFRSPLIGGVQQVLAEAGLGALAVAAVILAVAWAEHRWSTLVTTTQIIRRAGIAMGLSVGLVLVTLAVTNVLVLTLGSLSNSRPFQMEPDTLVMLVVAVALVLASVLRGRADTDGTSASIDAAA